ncbi:hypothetical protein [Demequina sp. NBRC 110054]|uniref:hypothetical protein n=1 Tax=Demequina sp. NBRC 110054 TaxID=1570343 RepID=UPI001178AFF6|nr:hypothetical protein [Demequina sp. NBRC 110054]
MALLAAGYANGELEVDFVIDSPDAPSHSARVRQDLWDAFKAKAKDRGMPHTRVFATLADGYAAGRIEVQLTAKTRWVD